MDSPSSDCTYIFVAQLRNMVWPTAFTESGIYKYSIAVFIKALEPIVSTAGIVMEFKLLQFVNAACPIDLIVLGNLTFSNAEAL